ncbi:hypothetical protein N752_07885 [Desulforamulus aquiferis]|nr:hypothetical protein N752_07885 [Desulforamulus aquiferis]
MSRLLKCFGMQGLNWLGSQELVMWAMIVMIIWKEAGYFMIFYLAGLQSISQELYESAELDGASRWTVFWKITFPLLMPTTLFVMIIAVTNSFKLVDHLFIMTRGGPENASNLLLYYIYETAFTFWDKGMASTLTILLIFILLVLAAVQFFSLDKKYTTTRRGIMLGNISRGGILALGILWLIPLVWAVWSAFQTRESVLSAKLSFSYTLANFSKVWDSAPFATYYLNTFILVLGILAVQLVTTTLAAYAFARMEFIGKDVIFMLFLVQIMVPADILIFPNYNVLSDLSLLDTKLGIMMPYFASAFGIFLLRQTFKTVPYELEEAAKMEGCSWWQTLWKIYIPLARPTYIAFGLVSVSYHWNNFLWPLIVTNSVENRPLTVGLAIFAQSFETGAQWVEVSAATLMVVFPLLLAFLLFQRQFMNSFMHSGIK